MKVKSLTIIRATGNGQSKCVVCGTISWDEMMYRMPEHNDNRICGNCRRVYLGLCHFLEQGENENENQQNKTN